MPYTAQLTTLQQAAAAAFYRHAARPYVLGPADEHERLWLLAYEARAAAGEGNPAFALTLLPPAEPVSATGPGLPLLPVGVRYVVDEAGPGLVTVTLDVAGAVSIDVLSPQSGIPYPATVTTTATRATATFTASADGLYALTLAVGSAGLATVYVPVLRGLWRRFREQARALGFAFRVGRPRLGEAARALLARLIAAEAAAHTGDPVLFAQLVASANALPLPASPVALYPYHG